MPAKPGKLGGALHDFDFEKLSGSDIIYDFCKYARENSLRLFFLGGKKESNEMSVKMIKEKYHVEVDGFSPDFEDYPFSDKFNESCIEKIRHFKPEILFIGFGVPKQEYWIDDHKDFLSEIGVRYAVNSGGTFDFVSGAIKRAPLFIQKIGLEGLYRFFQEPNKARFKRLVNSLKFLKYLNR
jgi:N-acetylglucosaminyldiphosphoundecaprenol N-acetyl-beta-D-mannosaminyltransferase